MAAIAANSFTIIYLLMTITRKMINLPSNCHTIMQIWEVHIVAKKPVLQLVSDTLKQKKEPSIDNQPNFSDS
jgi:hypothetical protein